MWNKYEWWTRNENKGTLSYHLIVLFHYVTWGSGETKKREETTTTTTTTTTSFQGTKRKSQLQALAFECVSKCQQVRLRGGKGEIYQRKKERERERESGLSLNLVLQDPSCSLTSLNEFLLPVSLLRLLLCFCFLCLYPDATLVDAGNEKRKKRNLKVWRVAREREGNKRNKTKNRKGFAWSAWVLTLRKMLGTLLYGAGATNELLNFLSLSLSVSLRLSSLSSSSSLFSFFSSSWNAWKPRESLMCYFYTSLLRSKRSGRGREKIQKKKKEEEEEERVEKTNCFFPFRSRKREERNAKKL